MSSYQEFILPLARFHRSVDRQEYEVVRFGPEQLELKARGEILEAIPYKKIEKLIYLKGNQFFPEMFSFIEIKGLTHSQSQLKIMLGERIIHLTLESGMRFQQGQLQQLFTQLYRIGAPLVEQTAAGVRLFMLEKCTPEYAEAEIRKLRTQMES